MKGFPHSINTSLFFVPLGTDLSHTSLAWFLGLVLTLFLHCPHDLCGEKLIFVSWTPVSGYASGKIITCLHPLLLYSITVGFHPLGFYRLQMLICSANHCLCTWKLARKAWCWSQLWPLQCWSWSSQLVGQVQGHNPEAVKSADQVRKLMLYAGLCTGRQELEPQCKHPHLWISWWGSALGVCSQITQGSVQVEAL